MKCELFKAATLKLCSAYVAFLCMFGRSKSSNVSIIGVWKLSHSRFPSSGPALRANYWCTVHSPHIGILWYSVMYVAVRVCASYVWVIFWFNVVSVVVFFTLKVRKSCTVYVILLCSFFWSAYHIHYVFNDMRGTVSVIIINFNETMFGFCCHRFDVPLNI